VAEIDRIRWHCRRGLLELDLVLSRFLDSADLGAVPADELEAFKALLELPDNDLWDLLAGRGEPEGAAQRRIVKRLRGL